MDDSDYKVQMLDNMRRGWDELQGFIAALTPEQMTVPTDAAGWTVKDHLAHLATWEDGVYGLFQRQPRWQAMGVSREMWDSRESDDYFALNEAIRRQTVDKSLEEVLSELRRVHERLYALIEKMPVSELLRPYRDFQPESTGDHPVYESVLGNTFGHYEEHIPWMQAIADGM